MRRAHVAAAILDAASAGRLALPPDAAHRFVRVLRLGDGERVELFDGTGRIARGSLRVAGEGAELVDVVVEAGADPLPSLVVAQAVVSADKLETVVQRGTELGAARFVLFDAARSQVKLPADRAGKRRERLARVAGDAARQCGRARVPAVDGPVSFAALEDEVRKAPGVRAVGVVDAAVPLSEALLGDAGLLIVVGPEGGLTDDEIARLLAAGAIPVRLGVHTLRTETAALAALAAAQVRFGAL